MFDGEREFMSLNFGKKECSLIFWLSFFLFGAAMGYFNYKISYEDIGEGIKFGFLSGIFYAAFFTLFMFLAMRARFGSRPEELKRKIEAERRIICEGPAINGSGFSAVKGWLFFTDLGLEFYPRKSEQRSFIINKAEIMYVEKKDNGCLAVGTSNGERKLVVVRASIWSDIISRYI